MIDHLDETWRPIPGYPGYEASDHGRIRSSRGRKGWHVLAGRRNKSGHIYFSPRRDGRTLSLGVHQAVLLAFVGPPAPGRESLHGDGDPAYNALGNLSYGTRAENIEDAKRHGTFPVLEQRPGAILTRQQAGEIADSDATAATLADRYGVSEATIGQIRRGDTWRSVTDGKRRASYRRIGEAHGNAKLTDDQVREIRQSGESIRAAARRFGVARKTISNIRRGLIWKHVVG